MAKIEYPVVSGKTVYECMTHTKLFGCRAFRRRDKLYTVNVVEVVEVAPGMKQTMVVEGALVCADCYRAMGYKTKWAKKDESWWQEKPEDLTPDMLNNEDDEA